MKFFPAGIVFAGLLATAAVVSANVVVFNFPLSGDQEVPPVTTPATGFASVMLDMDSNFLTWDISYQDLKAPLTGAHFHGPADFGVNASVLVNLFPTTGVTSGTIAGSTTLAEAQGFSANEIRDFIAGGMTYINLHSDGAQGGHGAGELRGQVVPEPRTYGLMAGILALGAAFYWRRRRC